MLLSSVLLIITLTLVSGQLPPYYQSLTALEKQTMLYNNIAFQPYRTLPTEPFTGATISRLFTGKFGAHSFTITDDEMPPNRPKLTHTYGTAGKVSVDIFTNSPYTGVFKAGRSNVGIVRLSSTSAFNDTKNFGPSMAIKILQDDKPSVNLHLMVSPDGQANDRNFFANPLTNFLAPAKLQENKDFAAKFLRPGIEALPDQKCGRPVDERKLPLLQCAAADTNVRISSRNIKAPTVVRFLPNPSIALSSTSLVDFRMELAKLPVNTVLYKIATSDTEGGKETVIGQLVLKSKLVASEYADKSLFFRHANLRCLE